MTSELDAKCAFYKALSAAQSEIEGAIKNSTNPHFRSKYADLGAVWEACRAPLTKQGISIIQCPSFDTERSVVIVDTIVAHESGYEKSFPLTMPVSKVDAQGIGSAISYARRYALMAAVGIAPEDDDGNAAVAQGGDHKAPATKTSALPKGGASRELYAELQQDIDAADTEDALLVWKDRRKADIKSLPQDWLDEIGKRYADKMNDLKFGPEMTHAAE